MKCHHVTKKDNVSKQTNKQIFRFPCFLKSFHLGAYTLFRFQFSFYKCIIFNFLTQTMVRKEIHLVKIYFSRFHQIHTFFGLLRIDTSTEYATQTLIRHMMITVYRELSKVDNKRRVFFISLNWS